MFRNSTSFRAMLLAGAWFATVPSAQAQIQSLERRNDNKQDLPAAANNTAGPDTTGIWHFLRVNDPAAARREIARLRKEYPAWVPPADMMQTLAQLENPQAMSPAPARAANAARPDPETVARNQIATLAAQSRWDDAQKIATTPALKSALADAAADAAQKTATAADWTAAMAAGAVADRNARPGTTANLGWIALDQNKLPEAARAFATAPDSEDAVYGSLLTLDRTEAPWAEIVQACTAKARAQQQRDACGNALARRGLAAYGREDWTQTIAIDDAMQKLGVGQDGIATLAAWSHYRRNEYADAARQFDALYKRGADVADGVVLSGVAAGEGASIAARARTDAKIATIYNAQQGELAFARKRFQLAQSLGKQDATLGGLTGIETEVGGFYRDKTGGAGQDAISVTGLQVAAAYSWDADRLTVDVTNLRVRIGEPTATTPIGNAGLRRFAPTTGDILYAPTIGYQHDGVDQRLNLTAGLSPIGGVVSAVPVGRAQWEKDWEKLIATFTVAAAPVMQSLLSMSGMIDPVTGQAWGRVIDIGPQVAVTYLASDTVALSGSLEAASLTGKNVASNSRVGASLSVNYQLKLSGFDYLRVGPIYSFQHYAKNQFAFSFGNGGYYSPDQLHTIGGFVDFLTAEGRRWQIGGRINAGWTHKSEAFLIQYPLTNNGFGRNPVTGSEFSADATVRASVLLGDHLRLSAVGRYTQAPSGKDRMIGVVLAVPFGGRRATFSSDMPRLLDRTWPR